VNVIVENFERSTDVRSGSREDRPYTASIIFKYLYYTKSLFYLQTMSLNLLSALLSR
jgi:hypothetical protein